jgi:hypothetical protein
MAANPKLSSTSVNAEADAVAALCNSGYLKIYAASQPATADTALSGQTLLATLRFGATAFGSAVAGVATANAITQDSDAAATGTAAFFRVLKSDNSTVVFDGNIGTSAADLVMATLSIVQHAIITITSFTFTASAG